MKSYFMCSLCYKGLLGGTLIVDEEAVTFKTGKLTIPIHLRNLKLNRTDIRSLSWEQVVFPIAVFEMKNGEEYRFLVFNKGGFTEAYRQ